MNEYEVIASRTVHRGPVITLRVDQVRTATGDLVERDVVEHPGTVMMVALDDADRVLLVTQYRHPVGGWLTELPAGLLDVPGESTIQAAQRELYEEADLWADIWHTLLDLRVSPGGMNERGRVYLARGLHPVPAAERHLRGTNGDVEEAGMRLAWVDLDQAVEDVFSGRILNATTVAGLLAAAQARAHGWRPLREPDAPWIPR